MPCLLSAQRRVRRAVFTLRRFVPSPPWLQKQRRRSSEIREDVDEDYFASKAPAGVDGHHSGTQQPTTSRSGREPAGKGKGKDGRAAAKDSAPSDEGDHDGNMGFGAAGSDSDDSDSNSDDALPSAPGVASGDGDARSKGRGAKEPSKPDASLKEAALQDKLGSSNISVRDDVDESYFDKAAQSSETPEPALGASSSSAKKDVPRSDKSKSKKGKGPSSAATGAADGGSSGDDGASQPPAQDEEGSSEYGGAISALKSAKAKKQDKVSRSRGKSPSRGPAADPSADAAGDGGEGTASQPHALDEEGSSQYDGAISALNSATGATGGSPQRDDDAAAETLPESPRVRTDLDESHFNRQTKYLDDEAADNVAKLAAGAEQARSKIAEVRKQSQDAASAEASKAAKRASKQEAKRKKKEAKASKAAAAAAAADGGRKTAASEGSDGSDEESVDAFRKRLSTKDAASLREVGPAQNSAPVDPNARCEECNMKNKWCVCKSKASSATKRPSVTLAGFENGSSSTDASAAVAGADAEQAVQLRRNPAAEGGAGTDDVGSFRKRLSAEIDEKRSAELAGSLRDTAKERDPNGRCNKCNNKNKWCMCGQKGGNRRSIASAPKLSIDGIDRKSSSSDPVLDLGYAPGASVTEGGDEALAEGTVFYKKPTKPVEAPTMWEQERLAQQDGAGAGATSKKAASGSSAPKSILDIDSKEDAEMLFEHMQTQQGSERETLPTHMMKRTASGNRVIAASAGVNASANRRRARLKSEEEASKVAVDPILGRVDSVKAPKVDPFSNKKGGRKHSTVRVIDSDDEDVAIPEISAAGKGKAPRSKNKSASPSASPPSSPSAGSAVPTKARVGERVYVEGYGVGTLSYFGPVEFAPDEIGEWCGIELDATNGKNNGTIQGVQYFSTKHETGGVFVSLRSGKAQMGPAAKAGNAASGWVDSEAPDPAPAPKVVSARKIGVKATRASTLDESRVPTGVAGGFSDDDDDNDDDDIRPAFDEDDGTFPKVSGGSAVRGPMADGPAGPSMFGVKGANEMHEAANIGNYDELKRLIRTNAYPIDCLDFEGRAPLMHAVHKTRMECVELLIKHGAEINRKAHDESTALHEAVYNSTPAMMKMLLDNGADPRCTDLDGREAVHWSTDNPSGPKCMEILLAKYKSTGIHVDLIDGAGMTPLMWAACHNQSAMVKSLLDKGASIDEKDMDQKTAIDWAVHQESIDALRLLLHSTRIPDSNHNPGTFYKDSKGRTVIHTAAERDAVLALELILKERPDALEDVDKSGRTPLFWAVACNCISATRVLLTHGANIYARDRGDLVPLDYAIAKDLHQIQTLLVRFQENLQRMGMQQYIQSKQKFDPTSPHPLGQTPDASPRVTMMPAGPNAQMPGLPSPPQAGGMWQDAPRLSQSTDLFTPPPGGSRAGSASPTKKPQAACAPALIKSRKLVEMRRYVQEHDAAGEPPKEAVDDMLHEVCLAQLLHPQGRSIGKYSGDGDGKMHKRFFRLLPTDKHVDIVWGKTREDVESLSRVTSAGIHSIIPVKGTLIEQRPGYSPDTTFAFVIKSSTKNLYLCADTKQECDLWVRGLRYMLLS